MKLVLEIDADEYRKLLEVALERRISISQAASQLFTESLNDANNRQRRIREACKRRFRRAS